jgi:hypothetical protein
MGTGDLPVQKAMHVLDLTRELADKAETALATTQQLAAQAAAAAEALTQPDFFDDGSLGVELATMDKPDATRHGKYTGEQLEARTILCQRVCRLLAEGMGIRLMAKKLRAEGFQIGERSIMALRDRRPDLVATEKKQLSQQIGRIQKLMADSIETRLLDGTMKPTSVDLAILIDKKQALDGEAGLIIEHRLTMDTSPDAFAKRLEAMKRAKVVDVRAVDCEATACEPETQQKGANPGTDTRGDTHRNGADDTTTTTSAGTETTGGRGSGT